MVRGFFTSCLNSPCANYAKYTQSPFKRKTTLFSTEPWLNLSLGCIKKVYKSVHIHATWKVGTIVQWRESLGRIVSGKSVAWDVYIGQWSSFQFLAESFAKLKDSKYLTNLVFFLFCVLWGKINKLYFFLIQRELYFRALPSDRALKRCGLSKFR